MLPMAVMPVRVMRVPMFIMLVMRALVMPMLMLTMSAMPMFLVAVAHVSVPLISMLMLPMPVMSMPMLPVPLLTMMVMMMQRGCIAVFAVIAVAEGTAFQRLLDPLCQHIHQQRMCAQCAADLHFNPGMPGCELRDSLGELLH